MADMVLQLERDVLGDMAEPRSAVEPLHEAAPAADRVAVLDQAGQGREQPLIEARYLVRRELLELAQIDEQPDHRPPRPPARAAHDARVEDLHRSRRPWPWGVSSARRHGLRGG